MKGFRTGFVRRSDPPQRDGLDQAFIPAGGAREPNGGRRRRARKRTLPRGPISGTGARKPGAATRATGGSTPPCAALSRHAVLAVVAGVRRIAGGLFGEQAAKVFPQPAGALGHVLARHGADESRNIARPRLRCRHSPGHQRLGDVREHGQPARKQYGGISSHGWLEHQVCSARKRPASPQASCSRKFPNGKPSRSGLPPLGSPPQTSL